MITAKRFTGDFSLISTNNGTITLGAADDPVVIPGNLVVNGTTTSVNSTDLAISDNTIVLNDGEVGAGITLGTAGIVVDRGSSTDAHILYSETDSTWVIDQGTGSNVAILTGQIGGGTPLLNVVEDLTPQLGGNLDVNNNSIFATATNDVTITVSDSGDIVLTAANTGRIRLDGPVIVSGPAPNTTPVAGDVAVYQAADSGGGTQIHFENDTLSGELVSKTKALVFGLIL